MPDPREKGSGRINRKRVILTSSFESTQKHLNTLRAHDLKRIGHQLILQQNYSYPYFCLLIFF